MTGTGASVWMHEVMNMELHTGLEEVLHRIVGLMMDIEKLKVEVKELTNEQTEIH
jgi:hypothetical protein